MCMQFMCLCKSHEVAETSRWDCKLCMQEGLISLLNVFQAELMSPTRSERCARCMCHVCTHTNLLLI